MTSIRELRSAVDELKKLMCASAEPITSRRAELLTQLDRLSDDVNESRTYSTEERDDYATILEILTEKLTR